MAGVEYTNPPQSRNEEIIEDYINGIEYSDPPQSRNEAILVSIMNGTEYTEEPQSRMEDLLLKLKAYIGEGIGGKVLRDKILIPDKYNTGCHGQLTKFSFATDTSGLGWRRDTTTQLTLDFNKPTVLQNVQPNTEVVFENLDFTDQDQFQIFNADKYTETTYYYKPGVTITFRNCLLKAVFANRAFSSSDVIRFKFENCTLGRYCSVNGDLDSCLIGDCNLFQPLGYNIDGDAINPIGGRQSFKNCYVMDGEPKASSSGERHIDGLQITSGGGKEQTVYNCRFECINMPYSPKVGGWAYSFYWEGLVRDSSIEYCIFHGGGDYGVSILKAENQTFKDNLISEDYNSNGPCYPGATKVQMSDGWATYIETLFVGSIWEDGGKIKLCVSNDMSEEKTLRVVDDSGNETSFTIPACPTLRTMPQSGVQEWSDLPFDIVCEIEANAIKELDCYDGETLIRSYKRNVIGTPYTPPEEANETE